MEGMNRLIEEKVIRKTLEEVVLKNRQLVLTLYGDRTDLYIQPSGELVDLKEMPDSLDEKTHHLPSWPTTRRDGSPEGVCWR